MSNSKPVASAMLFTVRSLMVRMCWRGTEEAWGRTPSSSPCPLPSREIFALRLRSGENPHPSRPQQTGEGAGGPERHQGCAGVAQSSRVQRCTPSPCPVPSRDIFALRLRAGENPHPYVPQQTGEGAGEPLPSVDAAVVQRSPLWERGLGNCGVVVQGDVAGAF